MAVVVVARELLVTALRSFIEQQGGDFSAALSGKLKMVVQCLAVSVSLLALWLGGTEGEVNRHGDVSAGLPVWLAALLAVSVWSAVAMTVISGVAYVRTAVQLMRR
jgi:CDP-diacylglycerol--glycerol-3-phosphate 3-phosphatidyltransferase